MYRLDQFVEKVIKSSQIIIIIQIYSDSKMNSIILLVLLAFTTVFGASVPPEIKEALEAVDINEPLTQEKLDSTLIETKEEGEELFDLADFSLFSNLRTFMRNKKTDLNEFDSIITLENPANYDFLMKNKGIAKTTTLMCKTSLEYAIKFVEEKLLRFTNEKYHEKLNELNSELKSMKENIEFFGEKFIEFIDSVNQENEDKKDEQIINEISNAMEEKYYMESYENVLFLLESIMFD